MNKFPVKVLIICVVCMGVIAGVPTWSPAEETGIPPESLRLLSVGEEGPKATKIMTWLSGPEGGEVQPGEEAFINVRPLATAYLVALYVSQKGDVTILFPNGRTADNLLTPGKDYSFFARDSRIRLVASEAKEPAANIVLYLSSTPFDLEPFNIKESEGLTRIPASAVEKTRALAETLEKASHDPGFRRTVVDLSTLLAQGASFKPLPKGLPENIKSRKPGTVLGIQGFKVEFRD